MFTQFSRAIDQVKNTLRLIFSRRIEKSVKKVRESQNLVSKQTSLEGI